MELIQEDSANGTDSITVTEAVGGWLHSITRMCVSLEAAPAKEWFVSGAAIIEGIGRVQTREMSGFDLKKVMSEARAMSPERTVLMHWMLADFISYLGQQKLVDYRADHASLMVSALKLERPDFSAVEMEKLPPALIARKAASAKRDDYQRAIDASNGKYDFAV